MSGSRDAGGFHTTRWSVVLAAGKTATPEAADALERLATSYWYPLYAYARRRGHGEEEAKDLTQGFFAMLFERRDIATADPTRGRFRAFLLTAMRNYLAGERARAGALKRGGGARILSIDGEADTRYALEPTDDSTPESHFERAWAHSVLDRTLDRLRAEYASRDRAHVFEALKDTMLGAGDVPYTALATQLDSTEGAIKVEVHRIRSRYRRALRAEIADTLSDPSQVEEEMRHLFEVLGG